MNDKRDPTGKTAFAYWDGRIAPVFDTAEQIHIVETRAGQIISESRKVLESETPARKAARLAEFGVGVLVCGAVSRVLEELIAAHGIRVIPFVAGDLREVIEAWRTNGIKGDAYAMPGCCGRNRVHGWKTNGINREESAMNGSRRGGMGSFGGKGQGGQGRGRMGGPVAGGLGGECVCPKCGHREPHERGVPCAQKPCPKCGSTLNRG